MEGRIAGGGGGRAALIFEVHPILFTKDTIMIGMHDNYLAITRRVYL